MISQDSDLALLNPPSRRVGLARPCGRGRMARVDARPADVVEAFLHHLAVERGSAVNTLRAYRTDLARYLDHLAALGLDDLARVWESDVAGVVPALRTGPAGRAA